MESNFNNREFERYVKKNADQYRMIPSEKVWKGINSSLHTRRRWYGLGLIMLLLLTGGSVTWVMLSYPVSRNVSVDPVRNNTPISIQPVNSDPASSSLNSENISDLLSLDKFNKPADVSIADRPVIATSNVKSEFPMVMDNQILSPASTTQELFSEITAGQKERAPLTVETVNDESSENLLTSGITPSLNKHSDLPEAGTVSTDKMELRPPDIESVVNLYKPGVLNKKLSWQLYFAPTVSYRKLSENKSYQSPSAANFPFASLSDVNKAVVHKPDIGLELGVSARYPLTKNLKLRGGLQFNINRYDIKAFVYNVERVRIGLSGGPDVSTWTSYRNYTGFKSDWLKNFYFTVSAPVGAELKLFGNSKTNFGIAATIQPTYILSDRAYLISTDYKNYAEVPWLIRNVNMNTSFETFVSYQSRRTRWQVGPQVRYQVLSSFQNKYPIKENLFDFGLKVGVNLNQ